MTFENFSSCYDVHPKNGLKRKKWFEKKNTLFGEQATEFYYLVLKLSNVLQKLSFIPYLVTHCRKINCSYTLDNCSFYFLSFWWAQTKKKNNSSYPQCFFLLFELLSVPVGRTKVFRSGLSIEKPTTHVLLLNSRIKRSH